MNMTNGSNGSNGNVTGKANQYLILKALAADAEFAYLPLCSVVACGIKNGWDEYAMRLDLRKQIEDDASAGGGV